MESVVQQEDGKVTSFEYYPTKVHEKESILCDLSIPCEKNCSQL